MARKRSDGRAAIRQVSERSGQVQRPSLSRTSNRRTTPLAYEPIGAGERLIGESLSFHRYDLFGDLRNYVWNTIGSLTSRTKTGNISITDFEYGGNLQVGLRKLGLTNHAQKGIASILIIKIVS
jgi:hypothetical protein